MSVLCTLPELCTYVYHEQSFITGDTKHSPFGKTGSKTIFFFLNCAVLKGPLSLLVTNRLSLLVKSEDSKPLILKISIQWRTQSAVAQLSEKRLSEWASGAIGTCSGSRESTLDHTHNPAVICS